jgi:glycosyltransferase involved in cell wall biosynthesis
VLFAAKFIDKKRPLDLIRAASDLRLANQDRPLHLLFVGSGELGGSLRQACHVVYDAEAGAANPNGKDVEAEAPALPRATFAGFLNQREISKAYVAADCLVLPSDHRETWGLVVNEALASGLPSIVSDACGCSEELATPINPQFRFPLGDTTAIADALLTAMRQPCPKPVLRERVERFNLGVTVNTVARLFHSGGVSLPAAPSLNEHNYGEQ